MRQIAWSGQVRPRTILFFECLVQKERGKEGLTMGMAPFIQWLWPSSRVLCEMLRDMSADRVPNKVLPPKLLPCT